MVALVPAAPQSLAFAALRLSRGELVAIPTETVYGLAADATQADAVAGIFATKARPMFNPLIVHTADAEQAFELAEPNDDARRLAAAFWPGPLTMILPKARNAPVAALVTAGLDTIAVRVPNNDATRAIIRALGRPIAAPSANRSGHVSPTTAEHVRNDFLTADLLVVDDGPCGIGLESTILDLSGPVPVVLRPGAVLPSDLERALGREVRIATTISEGGAGVTAPGQLASHYAPKAPVRLGATGLAAGEALLAFGAIPFVHDSDSVINLSTSADLRAAAARLFESLRALDDRNPVAIAVMSIPEDGLGVAINDRLRRAAAPRSAG